MASSEFALDHRRPSPSVGMAKARRQNRRYGLSLAILGAGTMLFVLVGYRMATGNLNVAAGNEMFWRRLNAYPDDPILKRPYNEDPNNFLVFLHVIGMLYMLLGLNTVCDKYFAESLEVMVKTWGIKDDVAGATFMAAGGSAPELFTSILGAVVSESDVGFGTIVGSAVFNVLFVIGCCGMVAPGGINLTWWPLFRDCVWYIVGLSTLAAFSNSGNSIGLIEAIILFIIYICYCSMMYFNEFLEKKAFDIIDRRFNNGLPRIEQDKVKKVKRNSNSSQGGSDDKSAEKIAGSVVGTGTSYGKLDEETPGAAPTKEAAEPTKPTATGAAAAKTPDEEAGITIEEPAKTKDLEGDDDDDEEEEEDDDEHFFAYPEEGALAQLLWYLSWPVMAFLYYFTPEPRAEGGRFMMSFFVALMWIALFSLFLVWWIEILTEVLQLPIIVMGFTVLAAGTSIPDLVSSMAVCREGRGDMAVSSSIGSNIFDILVGLPLPWILKIGIIERAINDNQDFEVKINSPYITFYVLILLGMVVATILSIHLNHWRLNKCLGPTMVALWIVFLAIAISVELSEPDLGPLR